MITSPNKILQFKQWLTLDDAAKQLSTMLDDEVTDADILQLCLERQLTLSVHLINQAQGRRARTVPMSEARVRLFPNITMKELGTPGPKDYLVSELEALPEEMRSELLGENATLLFKGPRLNDDTVLELDDEIVNLKDIWDLPMIGSEVSDVQHAYNSLQGWPAVNLVHLDGTFVGNIDGELFQLQESWEKNEFIAGSKAELESIHERIDEESLPREAIDKILQKHKEKRNLRQQRVETKYGKYFWLAPENFFPAGALPGDAVFVIKTANLLDMVKRAFSEESPADRPLETRERDNFLKMLVTIVATGWNWDGEKPYEIAKKISIKAGLKGYKISDRTLGKKLAAASEHLKSATD